LAYQGRNVRPILEAYAALYEKRIEPGAPVRNEGRPRIGIVVTHGHEGVFARCWGGIAERLSRQRFDVRLICSRSGANVLRQMIRIADDEYLVMPEKIIESVEAIRAARFDLLHYWEIGTDGANYFLPFFQPAMLQTNAGGWPVTSGHQRSTHFISWQLLEPPGAAAHYSEKLVTLERLPMYYERPAPSGWQRSRETWGIPADDHFYLCTQNLRKYHPQFDPILAELLRSDPRGRLAIVADSQAGVTRRLQDRWRRVMPDVCDRIQVMPRLERADYLQVVAAADVVLDTLPYGGGVNTVCDAMAVGTPMVSLPGEFQRSRWVTAVCKLMGVSDTIVASPAEYVERARRLASEPDFRRHVVERMAPAAAELFADARTIDEHNELFSRLIEEARSR
jgi:protein O-GlcNAc transferase